MPRALFEKNGTAVYISHLDMMRLFQRAFQRSKLPLTHTQGFNPRPSVSIAMPLSLGMESRCELLDFELEGEGASNEEIRDRLNRNLISGVRVLEVYDDGRKLKHLAYLRCVVTLEYDAGIPEGAEEMIQQLFSREQVLMEKKNRNGVTQQNLVPMIRRLELAQDSPRELSLHALVCCQNPTLNPMQMAAAIETYLPELKPDFVRCRREEIYDADHAIFR